MRSDKERLSFGAVDDGGPGVTSTASCEVLDACADGGVLRASTLAGFWESLTQRPDSLFLG